MSKWGCCRCYPNRSPSLLSPPCPLSQALLSLQAAAAVLKPTTAAPSMMAPGQNLRDMQDSQRTTLHPQSATRATTRTTVAPRRKKRRTGGNSTEVSRPTLDPRHAVAEGLRALKSSTCDSKGPDDFLVQAIVGWKEVDGCWLYNVKWVGYRETTWEPYLNFTTKTLQALLGEVVFKSHYPTVTPGDAWSLSGESEDGDTEMCGAGEGGGGK